MFTSSEVKVITEQNSLLSLRYRGHCALPERRKRPSETMTLCAATKVTGTCRNLSFGNGTHTDKFFQEGTPSPSLYTLHAEMLFVPRIYVNVKGYSAQQS